MLKVATVSPTPDHLKVVSLLKIPFPLPDIDVSSVDVRKQTVTPVEIASDGHPFTCYSGREHAAV